MIFRGSLRSWAVFRHRELLVLVVAALILYLSFMSCSFDEWDSYNFTFALRNFDVAIDQPHPPGYPLYVFFGRMILEFVDDPLSALTIVSSISGALMVVPAYVLTYRMYDRRTAFTVALALALTPAVWITSEAALSDVLFTSLFLTAICLLYYGIKGFNRSLVASWFVYGFAIGARPTPAALTPLALWVPFTILTSRRIGRGIVIFHSAILFAASVLIWFLPMTLVSGWDRYWLATQRQFIGASSVDFVWARTQGLDPFERLRHVFFQTMVFSLGGAFAGLNQLFASTNPFVHLHGALLIASMVACVINLRKIIGKLFLFLWFAPYFSFVYTFGTPNYPRYYLPIIPAIMIPLVASTLEVSRRIFRPEAVGSAPARMRTRIQFILPAILVISFFINTLPLAMAIHSQPAPTKQFFNYVTSNYPPRTVVIEFHEHRVFQYYSNEIRYLHCRLDEREVMTEFSRFSPERTLLMTSSAYEYYASHPAIAELDIAKIAEFFRDPHVTIEDHRIRLYRVLSVRLC